MCVRFSLLPLASVVFKLLFEAFSCSKIPPSSAVLGILRTPGSKIIKVENAVGGTWGLLCPQPTPGGCSQGLWGRFGPPLPRPTSGCVLAAWVVGGMDFPEAVAGSRREVWASRLRAAGQGSTSFSESLSFPIWKVLFFFFSLFCSAGAGTWGLCTELRPQAFCCLFRDRFLLSCPDWA